MASIFQTARENGTNDAIVSKPLHPNIQTRNPKVVSAKGNYLVRSSQDSGDTLSRVVEASGGHICEDEQRDAEVDVVEAEGWYLGPELVGGNGAVGEATEYVNKKTVDDLSWTVSNTGR